MQPAVARRCSYLPDASLDLEKIGWMWYRQAGLPSVLHGDLQQGLGNAPQQGRVWLH